MQSDVRGAAFVGAAAGAAAGLVILLSGAALAGSPSPFSGATGGSRVAAAAPEPASSRAPAATDNPATCGKCHSACEDGRSHAGLSPAVPPASREFPLDADGRTTCVTCHDPARHGQAGGAGGLLRIPNLRRELCLSCHGRETEAGPVVAVVSPREGAVVREERLALIGRASGLRGADLTVRLNGSAFHLHAKDGGFFTWLTLRDGVNRIEIEQEAQPLWQGEVFRGEKSSGSYERVSSGHRTGSRAECAECHRRIDELASGAAGGSSPLCYGCHARNDDKRFVHGPLAVGDCLVCHDPHGGFGTAHLRQEQALLCGNCHLPRGESAVVACNPLGAACVGCHDPHQSDRRYLLKGPQYTMR